MAEPLFVHLRMHSDYSMVDGLSKIYPLVQKASQLNMPALAITDFNNLFGSIKFYNIAFKLGVKPIIGADFQVSSEIMENQLTQLTILAANNVGYHNLINLISCSYKQGYNKISGPVINLNWLIKYNEGLILLSGGRKGDIGYSLLRNNVLSIKKCLDFYNKYFFNRYYLELTRTNRINEEKYLCSAIKLARDQNIPMVATNEVCFINPHDYSAHEVRVAIHKGYFLDDAKKRPAQYSPQQYLRSEIEMSELFSDIPSALKNSVEIAKRCNVTIKLGEYFLPKINTGKISTENYLITQACKGLNKKLSILFPDNIICSNNTEKYNNRLNNELNIINQMGLSSYFLIVMEFIQWAKDQDIPVGPGRGSGAGSLVAYSLNITDIDPIKFNLLFERFLNPQRITMPDFDIDFCMDKRDKVIEHVSNIYGHESVSQIITFGTMTAKSVIRDVGRVLGYPYNFVDRIAKLIPLDPGIKLDKVLICERQFLELYEKDEDVKILIDMARKLEGIIRNVSKHAGGVVIAPTKITDFAPIYCDETGTHQVTQFDKNDIESVGLVKFDFLGLRTLTVIHHTVKMINSFRKKNNTLPIKINDIPLNDSKAFKMLQMAETTAVFQLESRGMKDLIKRLKPDCFEDIIALLALFRPGPLNSGMVDNFIKRKHGLEKISYPDSQWQHNKLIPVLKSTYGIILYQEQVMQIAQILAGYSLGEADILRCAMGKKKPEEMSNQRIFFQKNAENNGIDGELAIKIFDLVEKFAGYGFNKSHSAAYALLAYQTLWLKANYPAEFMAAMLTADMDNTKKIVWLVDECIRIGLKVLPPNINLSLYQFHVNISGHIVYGIGAIKGIGENAIEEIIKIRNQSGTFKDLFDLCSRINIKKINYRMLEKLIISGSFDCLGSDRPTMLSNLKLAIQMANQFAKDKIVGQVDMFIDNIQNKQSVTKQQYNQKSIPWSKKIQLDGELSTLGMYFTGHPIDQYIKEIHYYTNGINIKKIISSSTKINNPITIGGIIISHVIKTTNRGNRLGICLLDDKSAQLEILLFDNILDKYKHLLDKDRILIIKGQISNDIFKGNLKMIANHIMDINSARKQYIRRISIILTNKQINNNLLNNLRNFLELHSLGNIPINIYYEKNDKRIKIYCNENWQISINDIILNNLKSLVGSNQVKIEFD